MSKPVYALNLCDVSSKDEYLSCSRRSVEECGVTRRGLLRRENS